ncbi:hypothetical protein [Clavibacter michiganensis]|uniref:Uncharacterized protein n=1 Tax=Clavibacter michiganensis subsp. insidiosus TaxID=33014 RepID=A0A0D5CJL7_9MICO|nr:hypothetical protein [Clavibacter michiganensis]AJW79499.1 hypothetical protein VO01_10445 [Clavibacter michiganensis subsp. insidiosus]AWF97749.1 hypothetical protein BEH61_04445 [Clavibacter michiganensis subsp. insidiosus]AWG02051.1 hypothetical protein BEH62_10630 [Clavibacter michiganensis subsp. insidiosus]OQJ59463.1 hypothetical protein B5P21_05775 [Clavibacter michiganensis subsp. insidiosus]RIJ13593.1 hypothetical protein DZF93_14790 [Clavibacter michiganensis subsp. insidiosus]
MTGFPATHALGRIDVVDLDDAPVFSRDVPLDAQALQAAWPVFEAGFDALRGRRMMGLVHETDRVYRMAGRPHIEQYRRAGEIDCLVPIRPAGSPAG